VADLTPKQERFVDEYLIDLNATQAAIRAGFSAKTAEQIGHQLLQKTSVAEAVARAKAERSARIGLTADRVLEELAAVAFARMPEYAEWGEGDTMGLKPSAALSERQAAAIIQVTETEKFVKALGRGEQLMSRERSIKLHDKLGALKLAGQHIGMFAERHEISGPGGSDIVVRARDYREGLPPFLPPADEPADA
jgi:phage terminase small subunit